MNEASFTRGHWEACNIEQSYFAEGYGPYGSIEPCVKIGKKIIRLNCFDCSPNQQQQIGEWIANSHLMAAAPDMYEALIQARGALRLDAMVDENGEPYGTTKIALEFINMAIAKAEGKE